MKKLITFFIGIFCLCLLTGCGKKSEEETTICSLNTKVEENNYSLNSTYTIYSNNNIVTNVETKEIVNSTDSDVLDYFYEYLNSVYEEYKEKYDGYDFTITENEDRVISVVKIDYTKIDMKEFVEDDTTFKAYLNSDNELTLEKIKEIYEAMGATCGH